MGPGVESEVAGASVDVDTLAPGLGEVSAGGTLDPQGESAGAASVAVATGLLDGLDEAPGPRTTGGPCRMYRKLSTS